ncbi:metallophosphoesterase 1 [Onthophagus taurus]|uniref:metallophosphoesterase 1 n=1 Tax=Onthophagus taurus TaxID=166361 RepID=UPI000C20DD09|nr:metallophosphoesterase 1 [Onthophagus taurus]
MTRPRKRLVFNKYVLIITVIFAMYYIFEVYLYKVSKYNFNKLECVDGNKCLRILLVADPQLIGLQNEIIHPLTGLAIFDSDWYLLKTYNIAFDFVNPHVVIFLGDLFDEGSTATQKEFDTYKARFHGIYGHSTEFIKHVYLPGDNDIGGEGYDIVTKEKVIRFYNAFHQTNTFSIKMVNFYKYNILTRSFIEPIQDNESNKINVGLSHIPLLKKSGGYELEMLKSTKPHVIFSAHDHFASIIDMKHNGNDKNTLKIIPKENKIFRYPLSDLNTYEFIVPTVSYRMGTDKIGHGYAIIEGENISYTVLWSPVRFPTLIFYGVLLFITGFYSMIVVCKIYIKKRPRKHLLLPI